MNTNQLSLANSALPAFSGSRLTYNEKKNILLTEGYTSAAGNTYFQGIRLSDRLVISYQLGQGHTYLFLNGMRIYAYNGHQMQLIAQEFYQSNSFIEYYAKKQAQQLVAKYLSNQANLSGRSVNENMLEEMAASLVNETEQNQAKTLQLLSK